MVCEGRPWEWGNIPRVDMYTKFQDIFVTLVVDIKNMFGLVWFMINIATTSHRRNVTHMQSGMNKMATANVADWRNTPIKDV